LPPNTDNFDESGSAFAFFCLSLLTLYLVPATISRVWSLFAGKRESKKEGIQNAHVWLADLDTRSLVFRAGNAQDAEAAAAEQKTKKSKNKEAEEKPKSSWPIRFVPFPFGDSYHTRKKKQAHCLCRCVADLYRAAVHGHVEHADCA